jgi:hypothetical protein
MLFQMGRLVGTPNVIRFCDEHCINIISLVRRHLHGDWGDMCESDKKQNDDAVRTGEARIFSAYQFEHGKIWIITEWDRSVTTVLLPSEY